MPNLGYALSSEEHRPNDLVRFAELAEGSGFDFALVSDHYHPWVDRQGQSPFVWSVIGGIARATGHLKLGTGVTCPLIRIHPAIIAQAAATAADMLEGRFFLGVGTGENLNEHILGDKWPEGDVRLEMLEEAIEVIRGLWKGDSYSHYGRHYTVDQARLYTLPAEPPPLCVAASGKRAAGLAGRCGDGMIGVSPEPELLQQFRAAGGKGRPCYGQFTVCWADTMSEARRTAHEIWPNSGLRGNLSWEVKTPKLFEDAVETLHEEDAVKSIVCGPDPEPYLETIEKYEAAGYDHVYVHQIGPKQKEFMKFFERRVAPKIRA